MKNVFEYKGVLSQPLDIAEKSLIHTIIQYLHTYTLVKMVVLFYLKLISAV